jgi:nucleoside-diphosphate-sugar epimerase
MLALTTALLSLHVGAPPAAGGPLVVVGAGVLGRLVGTRWRSAQGDDAGQVWAVTRKADPERDAQFEAQGFTPCRSDALDSTYPHVLFCASPSGNDDYTAAVEGALRLWDAGGGGRFVFTSSAGVYAEDGGGTVTEDSPTADTPRAQKLLSAERAVLQAGGCVVRLAGLYLLERGAHNAWLGKEAVAQPADGLINQIEYGDAADAVLGALLRGEAGRVYLAADDAPLSRLQICEEASRLALFAGRGLPRFGATDAANPARDYGGGRGKVLDSRASREALKWEPTHKTFGAFIDAALLDEQQSGAGVA